MADTNQINSNTEIQESEFERLLKLFTAHTLKADSALPPQTRIVAEELTNIKKELETKNSALNDKLNLEIDKLNTTNTELISNISDNFSKLENAIIVEASRAKGIEEKLTERVEELEQEFIICCGDSVI